MSLPNHVSAQLAEPLLLSLYVMASVVEARDPYTGGHLWRVSQFSRLLAEDLCLPAGEVARITLGGFLHDLGKVGVPDAILNKPDKLTDEEYAVIKTHPDIGRRLLASHPLAQLVQAAITQHHETPDGRGYPAGLIGDAIPLDARIVGVCDAFDAMTSTRPYRRGMPIAKALAIIAENMGKQFDSDVAARLIRLGESGQLQHIVGHSEPGIPLMVCEFCGPTMVVQRDSHPGDVLHCRACGGGYELAGAGADAHVRYTGKLGTAFDVEPSVDVALISELVGEATRALAA